MKERILAVERLFLRKIPLTALKIIRILDREYDIQADRKTVYDDIAVLTMFMNIQTRGRGRAFRYYLEDDE